MEWAVVPAPIGPVAVGADEYAVRVVRLPRVGGDADHAAADHPAADHAAADHPAVGSTGSASGPLAVAVTQLTAYFAGETTAFDLPLSIPDTRGSDFERAVWAQLVRIPYGETWTYGEVAAALGDTGAARAVGTACNRNPIPLIVPCHRVVGAGGKLVGFGGGLPMKRWLLEHEARVSMERAWR